MELTREDIINSDRSLWTYNVKIRILEAFETSGDLLGVEAMICCFNIDRAEANPNIELFSLINRLASSSTNNEEIVSSINEYCANAMGQEKANSLTTIITQVVMTLKEYATELLENPAMMNEVRLMYNELTDEELDMNMIEHKINAGLKTGILLIFQQASEMYDADVDPAAILDISMLRCVMPFIITLFCKPIEIN